MARTGRPSKISIAMQERLCALLRGGAYRQDACAVIEIAYSTFARWMERGKKEKVGKYHDFCKAVQKAEALARLQPTHTLAQAAQDNPKWAATWLKMRWPKLYNENRNDQNNQNMEPVEIKIIGLPRPK